MTKKYFFLAVLLLSLTACIRVHKMDIEQGNVITPDMVSQLHTGMSEARVKDIMGPPMLVNTFTPNRVDYVYTYKPGYGARQEKSVALWFKNGRLINIKTMNSP